MKAVSLSLLAFFSVVSVSFAQQQKVSGKAVIKTPAVQCDKCKDRVEFFIAREYGVSSVKVNIKQKNTTVTWYNDRTTLENIKVAIANLGFDADDIEAEESAFKRLPKECRLHKEPVVPATPTKQ
ncbi:MAG: cation transporter [Ferruginibacter sp.]